MSAATIVLIAGASGAAWYGLLALTAAWLNRRERVAASARDLLRARLRRYVGGLFP